MINKRKLDEVIWSVTYEPERDCAYSYEEYRSTRHCQEHVCEYVRVCCMPYYLVEYLYDDCYYDDIETVQANLDYVNSTMPKVEYYDTWVDITMEMIQEEIESLKSKKAEEAKEQERQQCDEDIDFDDLFEEENSDW